MATFRFAPRALLELGKELISSDEVALYELIKNAVDARSPKIEIVAHFVLPHSALTTALDALEAGKEVSDVCDGLARATYVDPPPEGRPAFLRALGRGGDPIRFRARLLAAYRRHNWIEVRDEGHGMSPEDLRTVFLTVGTRSRRQQNLDGANYLGDKGVGRLATMRLGDHLSVTTTRSGDPEWTRLRIDWSRFSHDGEVELEDIRFEPLAIRRKRGGDVASRGTTIRVSSTNADWSGARFAEVVQGRIARMVDPFEPGRGNKLLTIRRNGARVLVPSIPAALLKAAHATCVAEFDFDQEGVPFLAGKMDYRLRQKSRTISQRGVEILSIAQQSVQKRGKKGHAAFENRPLSLKALRALGPFSVEVYWFNRLVVKAVEELTTNRNETRAEIARWSGGPMLYRHGFRILPYGDGSDDWLELDRNAFGQSGFKLNRQQVIGRVRISSSHVALGEQTNREGLVGSDAAEAMFVILKHLLHVDLRGLVNQADEDERLSKRDAEAEVTAFAQARSTVEASLVTLRARVPREQAADVDRLAARVKELAEKCSNLVAGTTKAVEETVREREKFVHLAGIGLMTEFIFHELDRSVAHTLRALSDVRGQGLNEALMALEQQLSTLQKRISAFDELTGERRQTKALVDVSDVVTTVLGGHANQFARHGISVSYRPPPVEMKFKAVRGMIIQILENLVANAVYWLKLQTSFEDGFSPSIVVELDPETRSLTVEDNGPGVDPGRREAIFQPFVTSKPPGQGRGLGLYISRELAEHHGWQLHLDPEVGRTRPERCNTFVLDMDGKE